MIDILILGFSVFSLLSFLLLELLFLRTVDEYGRLPFLLRLGVAIGILQVFSLVGLTYMGVISWMTCGIAIVGSSSIYLLSVCFYILSVFSFFESSITTKILTIIGKRKGISKSELKTIYNKRTIFSRRMHRFIHQGDVTYASGIYTKKEKSGLFEMRELLGKVVKIMYP